MPNKYSKTALAGLVALAQLACAQNKGTGFITACKPGYFGLTFDDGPSNNTAKLLDILAEEQVKVTFFVLGNAFSDKTSPITKRAFDEGHQIASHTWDHEDLNKLDAAGIRDEMLKNEAAIKNVTGVVPNYMRPPYGNCNARCASTLSELGYHVVQWEIDSNDWRYEKIPENWPRIAQDVMMIQDVNISVTNNPKTGYISLQHDTKLFSVDQVPRIIQQIKSLGLQIAPIEQCLENPPAPMYRGGEFSNATSPSSTSTPPDPDPDPAPSATTGDGAEMTRPFAHAGSSGSPIGENAAAPSRGAPTDARYYGALAVAAFLSAAGALG